MREVWKDIKGYAGKYQASSMGKVRSLSRRTFNRTMTGRILKTGTKNNGYAVVVLSVSGAKRSCHVHSLVFLAFFGKEGNKKKCINHKNGKKQDNRLDNLELISKSDDLKHAYKTGLRRKR